MTPNPTKPSKERDCGCGSSSVCSVCNPLMRSNPKTSMESKCSKCKTRNADSEFRLVVKGKIYSDWKKMCIRCANKSKLGVNHLGQHKCGELTGTEIHTFHQHCIRTNGRCYQCDDGRFQEPRKNVFKYKLKEKSEKICNDCLNIIRKLFKDL